MPSDNYTIPTEREYERRLKETLDKANLVVVQLDHHGNVVYCNDYTSRLVGWDRNELIGNNWFDICVPPQEISKTKEVFSMLIKGHGEDYSHYENDIISKNGTIKNIRWNNIILKNIEGGIIGTSSIGEDITDLVIAYNGLKKINRMYAVVSAINQLIIKVRDRDILLKESCRLIVEEGHFVMAWIGLIDEKTGDVVPYSHFGKNDGYLDHIRVTSKDVPEGQGPTGMAARTCHASICNDIAGDPAMVPWRDEALKRGYASSAAIPLLIDGKPSGILNFYAAEKNYFDSAELRLLNELAGDIAFAINFIEKEKKRVQNEEELRDKFAELEKITSVMMDREERIIELKQKVKELTTNMKDR